MILISSILPWNSVSSETSIGQALNFPRWLMNDSYQTSQTSGITFLREMNDGTQEFLLADDIGKIHRLIITEDTVFTFLPINFGEKVISYLSEFPKMDFEEILYDKSSSEVYLSVEGNGENHLQYHGIFKLKFKDNNVFQDSVLGIEKMSFTPEQMFYSSLEQNTGYEGLAVDKHYFYLGLESVLTEEGSFSGHTLLRIADKESLRIVKEINTESLNISTICGLYSDEDYSLWGIDRNQKRLFWIKLDEYLNISECRHFELNTIIPEYNQYEYTGSLESVTMVDDSLIYVVDDPWHTFFVPPAEVLENLDDRTIKNFKDYIPVIYKFIIK